MGHAAHATDAAHQAQATQAQVPRGRCPRADRCSRAAITAAAGGLALLLGIAAAALPAHPTHAQATVIASDGTRAAAAFVAAWNQHDTTALLTTVTPDVVVHQRRAAVTPRGPYLEVADVLGRRGALPAADGRTPADGTVDGTITWAVGWVEAVRWAQDLFQDGHQLDVDGYEEAAGAVRFTYRARVNPYQRLAGVERPQGRVEATVRDGRIAVLVLESDRGAATQRDAGLAAAQRADQARAAAHWDALHGTLEASQGALQRPLPTAPDTQRRGAPAPGRGLALAAVALGGAIALAAAVRTHPSMR
jgi:hypothetical protein